MPPGTLGLRVVHFWPIRPDGRTSQLRPGSAVWALVRQRCVSLRGPRVVGALPNASHWAPPSTNHPARTSLRPTEAVAGASPALWEAPPPHGQRGSGAAGVRGGGAGGAASSPWGVDATRFRLILERARTACPFLVGSRVRTKSQYAQRSQRVAPPLLARLRALGEFRSRVRVRVVGAREPQDSWASGLSGLSGMSP